MSVFPVGHYSSVLFFNREDCFWYLKYMSKTSFFDCFEKTQKFFDVTYHHHKASYKGLGQFFSNYAETEKNYANSLLWQSQCSTIFSIQPPPASLISPKNSPRFNSPSGKSAKTSKKWANSITTSVSDWGTLGSTLSKNTHSPRRRRRRKWRQNFKNRSNSTRR